MSVCRKLPDGTVQKIAGHKRAWVDAAGNVSVVIILPDLAAATYTGNIYIGGTYITSE